MAQRRALAAAKLPLGPTTGCERHTPRHEHHIPATSYQSLPVKHESKATRASKKSAASRGGKRKRGSAAAQAAKKRRTIVSDEDEETYPQEQAVESNPNQQEERFEQPALVTGGTLKSYQLEGVAWIVSLWNNGISGILGLYYFFILTRPLMIFENSGRNGVGKGK